ncbi:hypothetical protein TNIN_377371 [Trichonephila inaurata madagascariensis]|uniref:Secreted protein n=1 Tax=Trichonephila inaurata madagascariensis TaxID=2747483 RepID=A0A8X6YBV4_9ARAC|nr:hypothetical protein TNIN_377371 [Trichonephila inaurata madagascariensis]
MICVSIVCLFLKASLALSTSNVDFNWPGCDGRKVLSLLPINSSAGDAMSFAGCILYSQAIRHTNRFSLLQFRSSAVSLAISSHLVGEACVNRFILTVASWPRSSSKLSVVDCALDRASAITRFSPGTYSN